MAQQATSTDFSKFAIAALKAYWGFLDHCTGTQTGIIRFTIKAVITLFLLCLPAAYLNGEPQPVASTTPSPTAVPAPTPTSPLYQQGLDQAMEAATLTQTAKTQGELLQVVQHWENAIGRLKLVPAEDLNYKVAQQKLGEYQKNLAYAQQRTDAAAPPPVPATSEPIASVQSGGSDFERFVAFIRNADPTGALIVDMTFKGAGEVEMTVHNDWHYQPKQVRLQAAQNFWKIWATISSPTELDQARIELVDMNGNRVGGSSWLGGSLIDVDD